MIYIQNYNEEYPYLSVTARGIHLSFDYYILIEKFKGKYNENKIFNFSYNTKYYNL